MQKPTGHKAGIPTSANLSASYSHACVSRNLPGFPFHILDMPILQEGIWSGFVLVCNRSFFLRIAQQVLRSMAPPMELCSWDHHVPTNTQMDCCSPQRHGISPFLGGFQVEKKHVTPQLVMSPCIYL